MALRKVKTLDNGYDVTYWRIIAINLNWARKRGQISLGGYKDRHQRFNNPVRGIMDTEHVPINRQAFETYFAADTLPNDSIEDPLDSTGLDRSLAYSFVRQISDLFSDAEDILE